jgi:hypothetical protein
MPTQGWPQNFPSLKSVYQQPYLMALDGSLHKKLGCTHPKITNWQAKVEVSKARCSGTAICLITVSTLQLSTYHSDCHMPNTYFVYK